ncbi:DsbE family thiol:disulfide interchange protein [Psychrosphaera sp. 1_MG-2023]|uniref:DsbE family thiol:disulfide interchange protein n=1 Tax=Psychrosphaera sp. 1_MG-2023 TaxID=3062643 RepID=UPI0026E3A786|nr:DsbE family thiol:disulfide interchange protein [Psychrosphaera sp. 1_MG-2023]MDO6720576.1 DsbE family thiol:disulfide interchange protein [Psychrosphaera sp. 1_MG-2023]
MKYKLSLFLPLIIFVILVGFLLKGLFSDPRQRDSAVVGKSFPEFQLPDLMNEEKVHSLQTLRGEKVLLNVWGTWCITCKYELPFLTKIKTEYGVKVVGIYYDQNHAPEFGQFANIPQIQVEVKQLLAQLGDPYQFHILDLDRTLSLDLGVTGAPETFLMDSNGVIKAHHMGDVNERVWRDKLAPIWNEMQ